MSSTLGPFVHRWLIWVAVVLCGSAQAGQTLVQTPAGALRGVATEGGHAFLGVPFAQAPVGALRWRPPVPLAPWPGVKDATRHAARCAEGPTELTPMAGSEDCLYLDVYVPDRAAGKAMPVMLWIHGGAFVIGGSVEYDGSLLARKAGAIVVVINYRQGPFCYLALDPLTKESAREGQGATSGNYAHHDQLAAMRWVRDNIAAFGGDPGNVTLFGESGGGVSVCMHLVSPSSAGLFHRAISQSGPCSTPLLSLHNSEAAGDDYGRRAGCLPGPRQLYCLRSRDTATLLRAADETLNFADRTLLKGFPWAPIVDGVLLEDQMLPLLRAGRYNAVPFLTGTNRTEGTLFVAIYDVVNGKALDRQGYLAALRKQVSPGAAALIYAMYPPEAYPSVGAAFAAVNTDLLFACQASQTVNAIPARAPVYAYEFEDDAAPPTLLVADPHDPALRRGLGSYHSAEIQYVFGRTIPTRQAPPFTAEQLQLSEQMMAYWANFARSGNPNGAGLPPWPTYDRLRRPVQKLKPNGGVLTFNDFDRDHHCGFWNPVGAASRGLWTILQLR